MTERLLHDASWLTSGPAARVLALLNSAPPNSSYMKPKPTPGWLLRFGRNLFYWLNYFSNWSPAHRREFLRWKKEALKRRFLSWFGGNGRRLGRTCHDGNR